MASSCSRSHFFELMNHLSYIVIDYKISRCIQNMKWGNPNKKTEWGCGIKFVQATPSKQYINWKPCYWGVGRGSTLRLTMPTLSWKNQFSTPYVLEKWTWQISGLSHAHYCPISGLSKDVSFVEWNKREQKLIYVSNYYLWLPL